MFVWTPYHQIGGSSNKMNAVPETKGCTMKYGLGVFMTWPSLDKKLYQSIHNGSAKVAFGQEEFCNLAVRVQRLLSSLLCVL